MHGIMDVQERCDLLLERYADYNGTHASQQAAEDGSVPKDFDELRRFLDLRVAQLQHEADEMAEGNGNGFHGGPGAAQAALQNAKLRRGKTEAMDLLMELQVIVSKGKRITKLTIRSRMEELDGLYERVLAVPDEIRGSRKIYNDEAYSKSLPEVHSNKAVTVTVIKGTSKLTTREAAAFRDAWEKAKRKQNEKLDVIALGLDKLQDLGYSMGEELDLHDGFLRGVEDRVDTVDQDLDNQTKQIGSEVSDKASSVSRFCCISFLVFVILALLGYLIHFI